MPLRFILLFAFKGLSPKEACISVLADIRRRTGDSEHFEIGLIAMNMKVEQLCVFVNLGHVYI